MSNEIDRGYRLLGLLICVASAGCVGFVVGIVVGRLIR
jgi:hypothetical protein